MLISETKEKQNSKVREKTKHMRREKYGEYQKITFTFIEGSKSELVETHEKDELVKNFNSSITVEENKYDCYYEDVTDLCAIETCTVQGYEVEVFGVSKNPDSPVFYQLSKNNTLVMKIYDMSVKDSMAKEHEYYDIYLYNTEGDVIVRYDTDYGMECGSYYYYDEYGICVASEDPCGLVKHQYEFSDVDDNAFREAASSFAQDNVLRIYGGGDAFWEHHIE